MVGVVLDVVAARLDQGPGGKGIRCGKEMRLAGGVAANLEQDEFVIAGLAGTEVEALVGLLEYECICRLWLAESMAV